MIAALFVRDDGPYVGREDVDPWHLPRDAREYAGPHPVVAHPPCEHPSGSRAFRRFGLPKPGETDPWGQGRLW